jgi:hypothetical protein
MPPAELAIPPSSDIKVALPAQDAVLQTPVTSEALTLLRNEVNQYIDVLNSSVRSRLQKLKRLMQSVPFFLMRIGFCSNRTTKADPERR